MAILAAAGRAASTFASMVGTRLELAAVEFQEDARRLLGYLALSLLAVFLAFGSIMLVALFVIVLFWDTHRLLAVGAMAAVLAIAAGLIVMSVRSKLNAQALLLADTRAELRKDVDYVRNAAHPHMENADE